MPDLTTAEVSKILQVTTRTVRNLITAGHLQAYKLDPYSTKASQYRITQSSVDIFLAARNDQQQKQQKP